jgi:hypothetical protein
MNKTIVRSAFTAIAAAAVFGLSAGTASADTGVTSAATGVNCPAQMPANPTTSDYINAWNTSGACVGGGAAGLVSSAWVGAIPTLLGGAFSWYR